MKATKNVQSIRLVGALLLSLLLTMGCMTLTAGAANAVDVTATLNPQIQIIIDGTAQTFYTATGKQAPPISYNGTTYLPIRAIGEWMGKIVNWDQSTLTATLSGTRSEPKATGTPNQVVSEQRLAAQIRQDFTIVVDGTVRSFTDATGAKVYPLLYEGSIYLPVRAIGELMGCTVSWHDQTKTVTLQTGLVTDADKFDSTPTTGTPPTNTAASIGEAKAKSIALSRAGLTADAISAYRCELDRDDGVMQYEISFRSGGYEYEVSINAANGTILQFEKDWD